MKLSIINLNLLVNLHVLLDACNVSRAAERLNMSQSTISKCLGQLREIFDDPLLVRVGNRLEATPRATQIKERLTLWGAVRRLRTANSGTPKIGCPF